MSDDLNVYDTPGVARALALKPNTLIAWLSRNPEYKPKRRISGDDLLWTPEDIERVKEARANSKLCRPRIVEGSGQASVNRKSKIVNKSRAKEEPETL